MVAPVVLVMASSSLILATSQRLSRSIERTRKVAERLGTLKANPELLSAAAAEHQFLLQQLTFAARRARLLQQSMTLLYAALALFVATILLLGITSVVRYEVPWVVLALGIGGVLLLFATSMILILESKLAWQAVKVEMQYQLSIYRE
jgi:hypothetical protein